MSYNILENFSLEELDKIPLKNLPLTRLAWETSRGAKDYRLYKKDDQVVAKVYYTYVYSEDNKKVLDFSQHIEIYDESGEILLHKELDRQATPKKLKAVNRDIRQGRIDYAEALAEINPLVSPYVNILLKWYDIEIEAYIKHDTDDLENSITSETNPVIYGILESPIDEHGYSVRSFLMHQLLGI